MKNEDIDHGDIRKKRVNRMSAILNGFVRAEYQSRHFPASRLQKISVTGYCGKKQKRQPPLPFYPY
ncbi:hypothetical protein [Undibacterium squillarum]|uniref:hypothetical protein n=1 Tax=Undibacterium squillarum TaxID=1131567 RepID=UPI001676544A|nr:hypothetical protein [Undibacterium squillarum]